MDRASSALVAVLAGGAGRRLGGSKACALLAGRPLIAYPLAAAAAAGLEAAVIAKRDSTLPPLECAIVREPPEPRHPLSGITAALRHGAGRAVVAIACDMPFLAPVLLAWLAALEGTALVQVNGRPQPLLARYTPEDLHSLERALERREPASMAAMALAPRLVGERELARFGDPAALCFNINDRADLQEAALRFGTAGTPNDSSAPAGLGASRGG